ncbi:MAG: response regulator [Myxococcales bacterium]|nr:response regulator [Myxococcales bacterium]
MSEDRPIKGKILIIDDDDKICKIMSSFLRKRDYEICTSFNGQGGLDLFHDEQPDVAIIDILLPDTMGTELLGEIRESGTEKANIPIILMSGISDVARKHYLSMCAHTPSAVVAKPFHLRHLLALIEEVTNEEPSTSIDVEELEVEGEELASEESSPSVAGEGASVVAAEESSSPLVASIRSTDLSVADSEDEAPGVGARESTHHDIDVQYNSDAMYDTRRKDLASLLELEPQRAHSADEEFPFPEPTIQQMDISSDFMQDTSELFFDTRATGLFVPEGDEGRIAHLPRDLYGDVELPELFFALFKDEFTGRVEIESRAFRKEIYFYRGHAIFASSNLRRETFGDWLVSKGLISREQHETCLETMLDRQCRYGEALVQLKFFSHQQLFQYLKEQCRDRIVDTFQWRSGRYKLSVDESVVAEVPMYELNMVAMIAEGVMRFAPLGNLLVQFNNVFAHFVNRKPNFYKFLADLDEYHLFQRMRRHLQRAPSVRELVVSGDYDLISLLRGLKMLLVLDMISLDQERSDESMMRDQLQFVPSDTAPLRDSRLEDDLEIEDILKDYLRLKEANFFDLFELPPDCPEEQVRQRFEELRVAWDPTRFPQITDRKVLGKIREIHQKIALGYRVLMNQNSRRRYSRYVDHSDTFDHKEIISGEVAFLKGKKALETRDFPVALRFFEDAVKSNPGESDFIVYLGWSTFLHNPGDLDSLKEAVSWMKKALVLNPESADAYYFLGLIALKTGKGKYARRYLQKCLVLDENHQPARKALTSLER